MMPIILIPSPQAVLESYILSLIKLPIKKNDEVIAFLTSDIVRETRQPVMQAGHKEGYLTKRGKNFGGWKTRYFVLSGPVLEYYESVSLQSSPKILSFSKYRSANLIYFVFFPPYPLAYALSLSNSAEAHISVQSLSRALK